MWKNQFFSSIQYLLKKSQHRITFMAMPPYSAKREKCVSIQIKSSVIFLPNLLIFHHIYVDLLDVSSKRWSTSVQVWLAKRARHQNAQPKKNKLNFRGEDILQDYRPSHRVKVNANCPKIKWIWSFNPILGQPVYCQSW